jgi:hypothetical protein
MRAELDSHCASSAFSPSIYYRVFVSLIGIRKKKEAVPILSAAVRLLRVVFSAATDVPEFQRQVATPNAAKFTAALISLGEKHLDVQFKVSQLASVRPRITDSD